MATKLINNEWCACVGGYRKHFICDTDEDFANLPEACTGSTAISIASGSVRMVNTAGEWVAFAE